MATYEEARAAVDAVQLAMTAHLEACVAEAPPPVVVARGEDLVHALLDYEQVLGDTYGWSAPFRQLGPPLASAQEDRRPDPAGPVSDIARLVIDIAHRVAVRDPAGFARRVQTRYGDTERRDLLTAVRAVVEAEMWRPGQQDGMHLLSTRVEARLDDE